MANFNRPAILERMPDIRAMSLEDHPALLAKVGDPTTDPRGVNTSLASLNERFLAFAAWLLDGDIAGFRAGLARSVALQLTLLDRFDAGEAIAPSYVSMQQFRTCLDAWAAGDATLAAQVADRMGGRGKLEITDDMPAVRAFGYALKAVTLETDAHEAVERFGNACETKAARSFGAYAALLAAIDERDPAALTAALPGLIEGHRRASRGGAMFDLTEDQALCGWGLGILNLARAKGMTVSIDDPLLPARLLV